MYRKEIKVLDCTIRDGGLINNYQFGHDFVKAVYQAACDAGVDNVCLVQPSLLDQPPQGGHDLGFTFALLLLGHVSS